MPYKLLFILSFFSFTIFAQVDLGNDIIACQGDSVILDATTTGATQYEWFLNNTVITDETDATLNVLETGMYKVVVIANGNTYQDEINITLISLPNANYITAIECDDTTPDGFVSFDLTQYESSLTDDLVNNVVTFFLSQTDAENNTNVLSSPFTNTIANSQELFVRVENTTTNCFAIVSLTIQVYTTPTSLDPLVVCESDGNGIAVFNLDSLQNGFTTYVFYESLSDAQNSLNAITNATMYSNTSNPQALYVGTTNTLGCSGISTMELQVFNNPAINLPNAMEACVMDSDGYVFFTFGSTDIEILGSLDSNTHQVSYHNTLSNANTGNLPYSNTFIDVNTTFYVRVENTTSGCFSTTTLDLVITQELLTTPTHLSLCDSDNNGFEVFDLTSKTTEILNGLSSDLYFYETFYDAQTNTNPITNPQAYTNTSISQTIYVRAISSMGCISSIVNFQLRFSNPVINLQDVIMCFNESSVILNPGFNPTLYDLVWTDDNNNTLSSANILVVTQAGVYHLSVTEEATNCTSAQRINVQTTQPFTVITPTPLEECIDDSTGMALFDLTSVESQLGVSLSEFAISYHESEDFALVNINSITNPSMYSTDTSNLFFSSISIRVASLIDGCVVVVPLVLNALDCNDDDGDGVVNGNEDINDNGILTDDDTDMDGIPNYLDNDDDGDSVATNIEINISTGRFLHPFVDTDMDLIENYLDNDDDGDGVLTINEDYNNNDDPTDDDTNNNSIPDYLDASVTLSVSSFVASNFNVYPNPATTIINIDLEGFISENVRVSISNLQGQLVLNELVLDSKITAIPLSHLKSGLYFLKFKSDNGLFSKKLIIQ